MKSLLKKDSNLLNRLASFKVLTIIATGIRPEYQD
jgi:hypothetical protein